ncbi:MAG: polysaccharide biosynthesis/export family protein, partial [Planctomycetota bacterium]|nr:polysaccharide biosynthesis/export family protein [Planctomycetota bacterium]
MQHRWLWLPCFLWLTFLLLCGGTSCKSLSPTQEKTVPAPSAPLTEERVVGKMEKSEEDSPLPAELFNVTESLKKAFCLKPGDEIEIRVFGRGDLTLVTVIPPDGTISFPLVGQVKVADVSPQEIERRVEETLKEKELVDPQVSVLVRNYAPVSYT